MQGPRQLHGRRGRARARGKLTARLAHELWLARTGGLATQLRAAGVPLPPEATPPPYGTNPEIENWIMTAFADLSTCRDVGMGVGPIPWTAIDAYATRAGLDRRAALTFTGCIRALDRAYLADQAEQEAARHVKH